jgi:hypothetical protein
MGYQWPNSGGMKDPRHLEIVRRYNEFEATTSVYLKNSSERLVFQGAVYDAN